MDLFLLEIHQLDINMDLKPAVFTSRQVSFSIIQPAYMKELPKAEFRPSQSLSVSFFFGCDTFLYQKKPTNEIPPYLVVVRLLPVAWPRHQYSVMFQASQPTGLEQVGRSIVQV